MTKPIEQTITLPQVNLNGDRRSTLVDQAKAAYDAALALGETLRAAHPHGRNYQLVSGTYELAEREWRGNMLKVQAVCQYYQVVLLNVMDKVE